MVEPKKTAAVAKGPDSSPAGWRWLLRLAWLLPPLVLAFLVWQDAVNVPYWDEWGSDMAGTVVKFKTGCLTFGDLWAQHNESRFLLLRAVMLFFASLTHWNLYGEVAVTFILAIVSAVLVFKLGQQTLPGQARIHEVVFFLASLLIFSPAQYEIWLWGMELILLVPLLCLLGCLLALPSETSGRWNLVGCALLATVSTYSFSNGLVLWLVLAPVLAWPSSPVRDPEKKKRVAFWLVCFAANVALYFQNYQFASSDFWQFLLTKPGRVLEFFLAFLGGPLARRANSAVEMAAVLGLVVMALFSYAVIAVLRRRKDAFVADRALPWLAVGGYGILSAVLATFGRASAGPGQALAPRYSVFGICLIIALAYLLPVLALKPGGVPAVGGSGHSRASLILPALGALVVVLHLVAFPANVRSMTVLHLDLIQDKTCLQFLDVLPPQRAMNQCLFPVYTTVKKIADQLEQLGIRQDSLIQSARLGDFRINPQPGCGAIEQQRWDGDSLLTSGWAMAGNHRTAADCVVWTGEGPGREPVIFALMDSRFGRRDLVAKFGDPIFLLSGWRTTLRRQDFPPGVQVLKAWAYDTETRQLIPLQGEIQIPPGNH
jgi:hypothetical protein